MKRNYVKTNYFMENRCHMKSILVDSYNINSQAFYAYKEACKLINLSPKDEILDLGCGLGHGSWFFSHNVKFVVGVDISKYAINFAKKHYKKKNILFIHKDITKLALKNKFDKIFILDVIEHLDKFQIKNLLFNITNYLKPNGLLIIHIPVQPQYRALITLIKNKIYQTNYLDYTKDKTHKIVFKPHSFKQFLSNKFNVNLLRQDYFCYNLLERIIFKICSFLNLNMVRKQFLTSEWHIIKR